MKAVFKLIPYGGQQWKEAVQLRENILRKPLGNHFSKSELEEEKEHLQIGGFLHGVLISSAVLVPLGDEMKMQRVVVREDLRNKRIGTKMMRFCEDLASQKNFRTIFCHARDSAVRFYLKNDYHEIGDYFDEDGIPHLKMSKDL
ncbi:MAG: GNAT family N-acetyltransferase [Bacteroidota bacterium]|nr:GNAT family N-acetyltransferase [Bacteroidota bacterium]